MVLDAAFREGLQSVEKRQSFLAWYGVVCAAMVAGLEGYGSALIGMIPSDWRADDDLVHPAERSVLNATDSSCNQTAAENQVPDVVLSSRTMASGIWRHA